MTPAEIALHASGVSRQQMTIAWLTAALGRADKMPKLKQIIGEDESSRARAQSVSASEWADFRARHNAVMARRRGEKI